MADDPAPLRYRTYLWFPVLTVGSILLGSLIHVYSGSSLATFTLIAYPTFGVFVAAFLGGHGLWKDTQALTASDADWRPSHRPYLALASVVALVVTALVLRPPVPVGDAEAVDPIGAALVGFTLGMAPACGLYLLVRWRRVGLNYL